MVVEITTFKLTVKKMNYNSAYLRPITITHCKSQVPVACGVELQVMLVMLSKLDTISNVSHLGRSRCWGRASAAGSRVKWRVPHRCQRAAPEPARRVGHCRCLRASVQGHSGTPRAAAPQSSPQVSGSAAARGWLPPPVRLCSSLPHLGHPCF